VYMGKAPASTGVLSVCLHVPRELSVHLHSVHVPTAELIKFGDDAACVGQYRELSVYLRISCFIKGEKQLPGVEGKGVK
jgi:hypothetical protein